MGPVDHADLDGQAMPWDRARTVGRRGRRLLVAGVAVVLLALPVAVSANHIFSDVPTSSTFHTPVSRLVGAGITGGCGGGKYCPNQAVTRGQMAAFLHRSLGRAGGGLFALDGWEELESPGTLVGSIDISSGGAVGGTATVTVNGNINVWTDEAGVCPCEVQLSLQNPDTLETSVTTFTSIGADGVPTDDPDHVTPFWETNATISFVFTVPSGTNNTIEMFATVVPTTPASTPDEINGFVTGWVSGMQAIYAPFAANGGNPSLTTTTQGTKGHHRPRGAH